MLLRWLEKVDEDEENLNNANLIAKQVLITGFGWR